MKKYKIVVLSDLGKSASRTLKSTVSLAKMINGEIELFNVKKPTDIVEKENQLSAMRTINSQHTKTDKKMRNLIKPMSEVYGVDINYSLALGNIKNEIENFIKEKKPDIIVLGNRKAKPFNFVGDNIAQFVLNNYKGVIMIANDNNVLEPNNEITMGMLNSLEPSVNLEFSEDLMAHTKKPLKSFKIVKNSSELEEVAPSNEKTIEYVFEKNDSSIQNLSNYLSKNEINMLYVDRVKKSKDDKMTSDIKDVINNSNITLLVSGR